MVFALYAFLFPYCITATLQLSRSNLVRVPVSSRLYAWRARQQTRTQAFLSAYLCPILTLRVPQVQNAKRIASLPALPAYQTELVRAVTRETIDLDRDVTRILEPLSGSFDPATQPATACALLVDHLSMRRNKRCLLAYHRVRAERLEQICWDGVDPTDAITGVHGHDTASGQTGTNASGQANLFSPEEEEYLKQYSDMLAAYKGQWTDIDLTGSLVPPKDLFVDVRVVRDAGEIQTEYGAINLTKNSQFYVRLADVERLIQQGFLVRLS